MQVVLAGPVNSSRTVIPKSTIDWQTRENVEAELELSEEDIAAIAGLDIEARFNDPSLNYDFSAV